MNIWDNIKVTTLQLSSVIKMSLNWQKSKKMKSKSNQIWREARFLHQEEPPIKYNKLDKISSSNLHKALLLNNLIILTKYLWHNLLILQQTSSLTNLILKKIYLFSTLSSLHKLLLLINLLQYKMHPLEKLSILYKKDKAKINW